MTSIQEEFSIDLGDENYDCWATERNAILALAEEVKAAKSLAEGLVAIEKSLRYFLTIELYLQGNSDCYKSVVAMVAKLLGNPKASPIMAIILETEQFLANIRTPTFAELSAQFETKAVGEEDVEEEEKQAAGDWHSGWPRSDRSIATLAAQAAAAGNAVEAETLRCVALLFADIRKDREEAEKAEEAKAAAAGSFAAGAALRAQLAAAAAAEAKAAAEEKEETETWLCHMREARLVDSEKFAELLLELQKGVARKEIAARVFAVTGPPAPAAVLGADAERKKNAAVAAARERMKDKKWGTLPYITDADFARYLDGQLPIEATERAFGDMEFFIWTRGIATYTLSRQSSAEKGCFVEELSGGANPCFLRPFPIDLHSEEGRAAYAAGEPLPHPSAVKAKRSWWSRLFLCGTVAVEAH